MSETLERNDLLDILSEGDYIMVEEKHKNTFKSSDFVGKGKFACKCMYAMRNMILHKKCCLILANSWPKPSGRVVGACVCWLHS